MSSRPRDLAAVAAAWADPAAWSGLTRIAGPDAPAEIIGLDAAEGFLAQLASPDAPSGPEVPFGPPRLLRDDACSLDRVMALAGRDPGWAAGRGGGGRSARSSRP